MTAPAAARPFHDASTIEECDQPAAEQPVTPKLLDARALYGRGFLPDFEFDPAYFQLAEPYQLANPKKRRKIESTASRVCSATDACDVAVAAAAQAIDKSAVVFVQPHSLTATSPGPGEATDNGDEKADRLDFTSLAMLEAAESPDTAQLHHLNLGVLEEKFVHLDQILHTLVENPSNEYCALEIQHAQNRYLVPPRSRCVTSDIRFSSLLVETRPTSGYDFMVMDPPFPNISASRGQHYDTLDLYDLFQLPVRTLVARPSADRAGGLVACWITHRPRIRRILLEKLFPAWGLRATLTLDTFQPCFLRQLTRHGDPVLPLGSQHRKPYERLLLGRAVSLDETHSPSSTAAKETIPEHQVFASIQCSLHSRKPPLDELFAPYLPSQPRCLELFARSMLPGWTSWGNEPLKFQHQSYFIPNNNSN